MSNDTSIEEMRKKFVELLEKRGTEVKTKVSSELQPFLDGIYMTGAMSRNFKVFKESYLEFQNRYESKRRILDSILQVENISISETKDKVYMLFVYLGTIEGIGNSVADILVMLLVANAIDFHIECQHRTPRIKHVSSLKDLEEERVPLTTKLNFLRDNGISELTRIIDSELRNAIAHLKFDLKENEIYVKGKPAAEIVTLGLTDLLFGTGAAVELLDQLAKAKGIVPKVEKKGSE